MLLSDNPFIVTFYGSEILHHLGRKNNAKVDKQPTSIGNPDF